VVAKLFNMVEPDLAVFGEKDYQQLQIVRRMAADLNLPVEIVGVPIVREADGLALSSRNAYLSEPERRQALCLSRGLDRAEELAKSGTATAGRLRAAAAAELDAAGVRSDYVEVLDPNTLDPAPETGGPVLLAIAAFVGPARLIDNRVLQLTKAETPLGGNP
jgi:pantoate--beta-alanine ligase